MQSRDVGGALTRSRTGVFIPATHPPILILHTILGHTEALKSLDVRGKEVCSRSVMLESGSADRTCRNAMVEGAGGYELTVRSSGSRCESARPERSNSVKTCSGEARGQWQLRTDSDLQRGVANASLVCHRDR